MQRTRQARAKKLVQAWCQSRREGRCSCSSSLARRGRLLRQAQVGMGKKEGHLAGPGSDKRANFIDGGVAGSKKRPSRRGERSREASALRRERGPV